MATDIKKFLDQSGVSTLWSRVAEEVAKVDAKAVKNAEDIAAHAGDIATMKGQIAALEAGTYDDTELRGLIGDNADAIADNVAAIAILNGDAATIGSVANTANAAAAAAEHVTEQKAECTFDEFQKMDIRVSTILEAEKLPKTKKLLKLTIDTGIDKRTIVSGIAEHFSPEELVGQQVLVLVNLAPRDFKGITSQGMILMAEDATGALRLLQPNEKTNNGAMVG